MANIDPNKYSKNKDIKPDSPLANIVAIGKLLLIFLGLIGIAFEFFKPDGWLKTLFTKLFESSTNMMLIPLIILVLWVLNRWMTAPSKSETNKSGDLPMYIMMALGTFYLFKLISTGAF
jgi:membrane protein insertase Oxa1/YidC/SpoIIIJ